MSSIASALSPSSGLSFSRNRSFSVCYLQNRDQVKGLDRPSRKSISVQEAYSHDLAKIRQHKRRLLSCYLDLDLRRPSLPNLANKLAINCPRRNSALNSLLSFQETTSSRCLPQIVEHSGSTMSLNKMRDSDPSRKMDGSLKSHVILNVGGAKHEAIVDTLLRFPNTRLGRLGMLWRNAISVPPNEEERRKEEITRAFELILDQELCDDVDEEKTEFYFDRHPHSFIAIINYYRSGKLHLAEDFCVMNFAEEMEYWEIDEVCLA